MMRWRVPLVVAALAVPVYAGALKNGWTFDDNLIIRRNDAAHSLEAAWKASLSPYWPVTDAGQYRPLVTWTYAVDWTVSSGSPMWFHAVNVVLHAIASALLAVLVLRWLPPLGAIVAGVVFAWHPVHVEAVANVVGRAELLTAIGLFGAVLAARRFRAELERRARRWWGGLALACVLVALLSKEHGVVAIALIAADEALERHGTWRASARFYTACAALTISWFYAWWGIAGRFVSDVQAAALDGLSSWERIATMLPAQLDVIRLLTWPSNLSADYNPLLIPQRHEFTVLAGLGLMTWAGIIALGAFTVRRAPVITFGLVVAIVTYGPTSNLLFASGVPLAERNLYMAAAALAVLAGWLISSSHERVRMVTLVAVAGIGISYAWQSVARVPFWADDETAVIDEFVSHPENYRNHLRLGSMLVNRGDTLAGLAQGLVAAQIFENDPWVPWRIVPWALAVNWDRIARQEAERAARARPEEPAFQRLVARAFLDRGQPDSALVPARRAVAAAPTGTLVWQWYIEVLDSLNAAPWRTMIAQAHIDWIDGRLRSAGERLDLAVADLRMLDDVHDCWDIERARDLFRRLRPRRLDETAPTEHSKDVCGLAVGEDLA